MIIGIIGLALLAMGWITEAIRTIKQKRTHMQLKFSVLYTIGSFLLVVYSMQIKDVVFAVLNGLVMALSMISLYYNLRNRS